MTSAASPAQAGAENRKVPAGRARRRSMVTAGLGLAALAAIWLVPALALRPMAGPAVLAFAFSAEQDIRTIRRALDAGMRQPDGQIVKVSRLARAVLGIKPLQDGYRPRGRWLRSN